MNQVSLSRCPAIRQTRRGAFGARCSLVVALATLTGCLIEHPREIEARAPSYALPAQSVAAPAPPRGGVSYAIRNVQDGEVITGPKAVSDAFVGVDDDRGRASQRWTLLPLGGGRMFQLRVNDAGLCLADHGNGVIEENCDASRPDQHWLVIPHGGHHEIMFRDNAHCLAITSRGKLVDDECRGDPRHFWDFVVASR